MKRFTCLCMIVVWGLCPTAGFAAENASIKDEGNRWILSTGAVERVVALEDGKLLLKSLKDRATGRELVAAGTTCDEFAFALGDAKNVVTSSMGPWKLVQADQRQLPQGEQQLDITVEGDGLQVTKSYVIYPGSSIIREWLTFKNAGAAPVTVIEPSFLTLTAKVGEPAGTEFSWMIGGECRLGSWRLISERLAADKPRTFDSYEPFPFDVAGRDPGAADGTNSRIMLNDKQVWPAEGWAYSSGLSKSIPFDVTIEVKAGDRLSFEVHPNKNYIGDTTTFDPTITWADGEKHTASAEFLDQQGANGWRYQFVQEGKFVDMVYHRADGKWRREGATDTPFVSPDALHPDPDKNVARVWVASKQGTVRVTGFVCNRGNPMEENRNYGFRPGTASYAPWNGLYNPDAKQGVFLGWDCFGHWASSFRQTADGSVVAQYRVAGYKQTLQPGQSLTTPKGFVGLYRDDIDNAGNECLDWQYRYLWDYTREPWFPAIRMLGFWDRGTGWNQEGTTWLGGKADQASAFRKVFRIVDLMRYCGADVYHRDWGWWDRAGDWNGPDFRATHDYLKKYAMGQLIYAFLYTVDQDSQVAKQHPEWLVGNTLDMSNPQVVEFIKGQLDAFVAKWGELTWRNDSGFTTPRDGDDTVLVGQDQGFRKVLQDFLDKHPDCAFQGVNGGGNYGGYDYTRFSSSFSFSDGGVGILRNYWAALLFPPDKTSDIPESTPPDGYDKKFYRGKLCMCFDMYGDTWDPAKLEGVRELIDIYHYLKKHEVVGRWVKVYRPTIVGDPDPTMYFERLSGDRKRGIVIPKRPAPGPVTIKPKGLLPDENYTVSFQESEEVAQRTGRDLMENGVSIEKMADGELIYLNLPLHPGSKLDKEPPTAPGSAAKQWASNMGYPGVEISWKPSTDNNWVSYYEIWRNGKPIDKVAKGVYYFDHSAGADVGATYEVCTVDGAGNVSPKTPVSGPASTPAIVFDDATQGGMAYTGNWTRETNLQPAYEGTIASADKKGDAAELAFEGKRVLWFSKLGADCGKASVRIDGGEPTVVDTYSADDIWGVGVFECELTTAGKHTIRVEVLGEKGPKSKGTKVYLDGIQTRAE